MAERRYEISLQVLKNISRVSAANSWNIFSTLEEKFRISKRPCNILYIFCNWTKYQVILILCWFFWTPHILGNHSNTILTLFTSFRWILCFIHQRSERDRSIKLLSQSRAENYFLRLVEKKKTYRGHYTVERRFLVAGKTIFYKRAQRVGKILFCLPRENKIHIFKPPCNVLFII